MFRTELSSKASFQTIQLADNIVSLGSCFAENMGKQLHDHKFNTYRNPFGIIFNPLSIFELMEKALNKRAFEEPSFLVRDGIHFNYKVHSELNGKSFIHLESQLNRHRNGLYKALRKANVVVLTFGTAWVYEQKKSHMLVANCHKQPASEFNKRLLAVEEIVSAFMVMKEALQSKNPSARFILSVSPVRHLKDTLELNMVSKSTLRLACHHLSAMAEDVEYFPAYELLMDDLRDYRFYEKDMLHPTEQAKEYVWQKFQNTYFHKDTIQFVKEWDGLRNALNHRAFHPESEAHQNFLRATLEKLENMAAQVNVDREINKVKSQLTE